MGDWHCPSNVGGLLFARLLSDRLESALIGAYHVGALGIAPHWVGFGRHGVVEARGVTARARCTGVPVTEVVAVGLAVVAVVEGLDVLGVDGLAGHEKVSTMVSEIKGVSISNECLGTLLGRSGAPAP